MVSSRWAAGRFCCGLREKGRCLRVFITPDSALFVPTDILGMAFSVEQKVCGKKKKEGRKVALISRLLLSVGQAPISTACVAQKPPPGKLWEPHLSLSKESIKTRLERAVAFEPDSGPEVLSQTICMRLVKYRMMRPVLCVCSCGGEEASRTKGCLRYLRCLLARDSPRTGQGTGPYNLGLRLFPSTTTPSSTPASCCEPFWPALAKDSSPEKRLSR